MGHWDDLESRVKKKKKKSNPVLCCEARRHCWHKVKGRCVQWAQCKPVSVTVVSCAQRKSPVNNVRESVQVRTAGSFRRTGWTREESAPCMEHARATTESGS